MKIDEEVTHLDETAITNAVKDLDSRIAETATARREAENKARLAGEREASFRAQVASRRCEEEALRKQAEAEATRRTIEDEETLQAEHATGIQAEDEARRLGDLEASLRLKAISLQKTSYELAQKRLANDYAARAARLTQAERLRLDAEERHTAELESLRREEEALRQETVQAAQRRIEIDAARHDIKLKRQLWEEEKAQLVAAQVARTAEVERIRREAEDALQDAENRIRSEQEQLLLLRTAEAEAHRRIEEAEILRRRAEEKCGLTTERLQRIETEAHARATEEERILAKLEEVKRNVIVEAQAREEQEKRIREEIEGLQRLEAEQRQLLADEIRRRREAEALLQRAKDSYTSEQKNRTRAEVELELIVDREQQANKEEREWHDDPNENLRRVEIPGSVTMTEALEASISTLEQPPGVVDSGTISISPESVIESLSSSDVSVREAAVATLPSLGVQDTFALIVNCFDDPSLEIRNAAARALYELEPHRPVEPFTRALEEGSPERQQRIGNAIATSGLAAEAIEALGRESKEDTYNALSLLFAMAKTRELQPLVKAVEEHPELEVRRAAVKLLTLTGQSGTAEAAAKRRLITPVEGQ